MLCAVAGNKTSVQKTTAWNMYDINYIKKSKAFFTHYAYNRNNLYFPDMVPYIKNKVITLLIHTHTQTINFILYLSFRASQVYNI